MDIHTATEQAYKNGYEAGIKDSAKGLKEFENMADNLIVVYDCYRPDTPTLHIARKEEGKIRIIHTMQGEEALYTYVLLTGNAELID